MIRLLITLSFLLPLGAQAQVTWRDLNSTEFEATPEGKTPEDACPEGVLTFAVEKGVSQLSLGAQIQWDWAGLSRTEVETDPAFCTVRTVTKGTDQVITMESFRTKCVKKADLGRDAEELSILDKETLKFIRRLHDSKGAVKSEIRCTLKKAAPSSAAPGDSSSEE